MSMSSERISTATEKLEPEIDYFALWYADEITWEDIPVDEQVAIKAAIDKSQSS